MDSIDTLRTSERHSLGRQSEIASSGDSRWCLTVSKLSLSISLSISFPLDLFSSLSVSLSISFLLDQSPSRSVSLSISFPLDPLPSRFECNRTSERIRKIVRRCPIGRAPSTNATNWVVLHKSLIVSHLVTQSYKSLLSRFVKVIVSHSNWVTEKPGYSRRHSAWFASSFRAFSRTMERLSLEKSVLRCKSLNVSPVSLAM